jgi:S-adenosylmethionine decarboxylase
LKLLQSPSNSVQSEENIPTKPAGGPPKAHLSDGFLVALEINAAFRREVAMHLTVDGYGGSPEALADKNVIRAFLESYPDRIGMTRIAQPHVTDYQADNPEDSGISGFVLIAESHISIHTFPRRRFTWVDIFSCKGFDSQPALDFIRDTFQLERMETRTLQRGFEFPQNVPASALLAAEERVQVVGVLSGSGTGA